MGAANPIGVLDMTHCRGIIADIVIGLAQREMDALALHGRQVVPFQSSIHVVD